jgi:tetratricopeptide (TPR) repeat protein/CHAT domain-containing protein
MSQTRDASTVPGNPKDVSPSEPAGEGQSKLIERDRCEREAFVLWKQGRQAEAIAAAEKMLAINRHLFGDSHAEVARSLRLLAALEEAREDFDAAQAHLEKMVTVNRQLYGPRDWRVIDIQLKINDLAVEGAFPSAARRQRLELRQNAHTFTRQGESLCKQGRYAAAQKPLNEALAVRQKLYPKTEYPQGHPDLAASLYNLAALYKSMGHYAQAEQLYLQARDIVTTCIGEAHPNYAAILNNLAGLYESMGDYARAEQLYRQALDIDRKVLGEAHPKFANSLNNLALLYQSMGDYALAEPLYLEARDIFKNVLGETHPKYATSLNNLGVLYMLMGDYARAEPLLVEAREIRKNVLGEKHPEYANSLHNLAGLYESMGDYARAERLYVQALDIKETVLGKTHPEYAANLGNLAGLYESMGDYAQAEFLYIQARDIRKKVLGEKHPVYATSLNNLASLYESIGDYARAEPLYIQARDIRKKVLREEHPDYGQSLNNLAGLYKSMGDYARAETLHLQALDIRKKVLGEEHPGYAMSLNNLAFLYQLMGDYARAEPLYLQACDIRKKVFGEKHLDYAASLDNLAFLYESMGDYARAERYADDAFETTAAITEDVLPWLPEHRAMQFMQSLGAGTDRWLSIARHMPEDARPEPYGRVWRFRGLVTRTLTQRKKLALRSPLAAELYTQLRSTQEQLAQWTWAALEPRHQQARRKRLDDLNEKKEKLESDLARVSQEYRRWTVVCHTEPGDLRQALPSDWAVVEFVRHCVWSPPEIGRGEPSSERHYDAFVVRSSTRNTETRVPWIRLGPSEPIDAAVWAWRRQIGGKGVRPEPGVPSRAVVRRLVWEKIEPYLGDSETVILIPDGALNFVPWVGLPGRRPGTCLLEDYALAVADNGPELCRALATTSGGEDEVVLVGGVFYDKPPVADVSGLALVSVKEGRTREPAMNKPLTWSYLPGTKAEVDSIARLMTGSSALVLDGARASEAAVKRRMPESRYVHLATHGFFAAPGFRSLLRHDTAGDQLFGGSGELVTRRRAQVTFRNPLLLSGVVLAGANLPREKDTSGQPVGDDGILTGEEIVSLDLRKTELAVLSACDTGLGAVADGEGVMSLARAFHLAGVRNVIASLWKVDDEATAALMKLFFYKLWQEKQPPIEALRQAQLAIYRDPARIKDLANLQGEAFAQVVRGPGPPKRMPPGESRNIRKWAGFVLSGPGR